MKDTSLKKSLSSQMMEQSGLAINSSSGELQDMVPGEDLRSRTEKAKVSRKVKYKQNSIKQLTPTLDWLSFMLDNKYVD